MNKAICFSTTLFLASICSVLPAAEIRERYVLSVDVPNNAVRELKAEFEVTLKVADVRQVDPYFQQLLRDEAAPILESIRTEILSQVQATDAELKRDGITDDEREMQIVILNSTFDALAAYAAEAVDLTVKKAYTEKQAKDKKFRNWKIELVYQVIRDTTLGSFTLATAIASAGISGPAEVIDLIVRGKRLATNLKKAYLSEVQARYELEVALNAYIDEITRVRPPAPPTTAERFRNLFNATPAASLDAKVELYEIKLIALEQSIQKLSRQLDASLQKQEVVAATGTEAGSFITTCSALLAKIETLHASRREPGKAMLLTSRQILEQGRAQQTRTKIKAETTAATDKTLKATAIDSIGYAQTLVLADPVGIALTAFELAADEAVRRYLKK